MPGITRRGLAAGVASAAVVAGRSASAQVGEVTRNLPRTYAGTRLNLAWGTGQVNVTMADFSREFSDATGINLQFTSLNSDDLQQKTILDTATKTNAFDVYLNAYQWKQEIGPYLADLTDIDKQVKGCPPLDLDDFPKAAFDVYSRFGNKLMAIPINGSATCFVWNKKAFRDAGLDPDAAPKSWQDVYDHGSKLMAGKQYGFNMPAGKSIQAACMWITVFHGFGGSYTDAKGMPTLNSPAGLRATKFIVEQLQKISPPGNLTWDFPEMVNACAVGASAQGFMWGGGFSTLLDPGKSVVAADLGWSPTPEAVLLGGWGLSVGAASKNIDAAKLFVGWITSKENSIRLSRMHGQPARISAFTDPEAVKKYRQLPVMLAAMQANVAKYMPIKDNGQVNIFIYDEVNAACAGTKSATDAVNAIQEKTVALMKRRGYLPG